MAYENAPPLDVKMLFVTVIPRVRYDVELTVDQACAVSESPSERRTSTPTATPSLICAPCVEIVLLSTVTRVSPSHG